MQLSNSSSIPFLALQPTSAWNATGYHTALTLDRSLCTPATHGIVRRAERQTLTCCGCKLLPRASSSIHWQYSYHRFSILKSTLVVLWLGLSFWSRLHRLNRRPRTIRVQTFFEFYKRPILSKDSLRHRRGTSKALASLYEAMWVLRMGCNRNWTSPSPESFPLLYTCSAGTAKHRTFLYIAPLA